MIRKLIRQMLSAQILSALTVSLCLLIDSVMITRYLGENAIAAYGMANPLLLAIGAIGTLLSAGVQVVCSKALGRGSQKDANAGYSSAVAVAAVVSVAFMAAVLLTGGPLARILGAGKSGELHDNTRDYLRGFSIGAPASMGALVLVPFLQMAGQSGLLIAAVLAMTVTDVALDLLNVLVFHGGMFGMGLASALSYYAALVVGGGYLLSKKSVFRFSRKHVTGEKIRELFRNGIPAGVTMLSSVILVFAMNRLLRRMDAGGSAAVAAYTVFISVGNAANCITTGLGGVSLTLCGILFHEEDRSGLRETVKLLCGHSVALGLAVGILLLAFAPALISVFIPETGRTQEAAVLGLRLFAAGLIPCCVNNVLKYAYQATGRPGLTEAVSFLEGAAFPVLAALVLSRFLQFTGAWLAFAAGETLTLLCVGMIIRRKTGKTPWKDGAYLMLGKDFGAPAGQTLEMAVTSVPEVVEASQAAERFCLERGENARTSSHIGLCIEEMAGNVMKYGFQDGKPHHLSVFLLNKPDHWVLRFRDDCRAFDPVRYVPAEEEQPLGIRLAMALVDDASYTYSMNLNNLALRLVKDSRIREPAPERIKKGEGNDEIGRTGGFQQGEKD